ncbi:hypothetical protein MOMA_04960 [Moraxella macacae 0408225]|uniref:Uncharacterized protein n=1 Tax=Moraxella macacae 0408225 TaxID=1230338 RepID=L2F9H9_9GAMM|nr:hypothetical protein [Moraxella macacae]ELA09724.1 hypothetical protein MOMA_04960 [Moraxella macacae 0408225]
MTTDTSTQKNKNRQIQLKNGLLAVGLMLFLAICFKLAGDWSEPTGALSQSDSVLSEIQNSPK